MRFWTIWTLRGMSLRERLDRTLEWLCLIVADWLPKRLAYWIALRQIGKATMTSQNVPATTLDNVLRNLGNIREGKPLEVFEWHESMRYPEDKHDKHINVAPSQLFINPERFKEVLNSQAERTRRASMNANKENPNGQ